MRIALGILGVSLIFVAQPSFAQDAAPAAAAPAAELSAGAEVFDTKGGLVGTIESVAADSAVVSTGTQKVTLPKTTFAKWPKGLVIAMSRDELNAAAIKAAQENAAASAEAAAEKAAALQAALAPGAQTYSFHGAQMVGTIKTIEGDLVTLGTEKGDVRLPKSAFVMGTAGLSVGMTAEQFQAAIQQASSGATAPAL